MADSVAKTANAKDEHLVEWFFPVRCDRGWSEAAPFERCHLEQWGRWTDGVVLIARERLDAVDAALGDVAGRAGQYTATATWHMLKSGLES